MKQNNTKYRVGVTENGDTSLTILGRRLSMSLIMNKEEWEKLIRILRATYTDHRGDEKPTTYLHLPNSTWYR